MKSATHIDKNPAKATTSIIIWSILTSIMFLYCIFIFQIWHSILWSQVFFLISESLILWYATQKTNEANRTPNERVLLLGSQVLKVSSLILWVLIFSVPVLSIVENVSFQEIYYRHRTIAAIIYSVTIGFHFISFSLFTSGLWNPRREVDD